MIDLLKTKWNTFVKAKFYRQFYMFAIYFLISLFAFTLRPKAYTAEDDVKLNNATEEIGSGDGNLTAIALNYQIYENGSVLCNYTDVIEKIDINYSVATSPESVYLYNRSSMEVASDEDFSYFECPLLDISTLENKVSIGEFLEVDYFTYLNCFRLNLVLNAC